MKKTFLLIVGVMLITTNLFSQKVCESPDEASSDLNSITKCTIKPSKNGKDKKTRQIAVKVSASKRYLKKREAARKQNANTLGRINGSGISSSNENTNIDGSLALKSNIEDVKNKLSAEEVRMASKFSVVDRIPAFEACGNISGKDRANCFNEEMVKHIQKYFKYPSQAVKDLIQGEVWVRFIIDKNGEVRNIKTLGPKNGKILNNEAKRVVAHLPKFKPARKDGKRVAVKYGFPITFSLDE